MFEMHPREKLPKLTLTPDIEERAYGIPDEMKISLKLQTRPMQWERQFQ